VGCIQLYEGHGLSAFSVEVCDTYGTPVYSDEEGEGERATEREGERERERDNRLETHAKPQLGFTHTHTVISTYLL